MNTTLDKLPLNTSGIVTKINMSGPIYRRILDLGIVNGTKITPLFKSPFSNPTAYEVRNTILAIRNSDCKNIYIKY